MITHQEAEILTSARQDAPLDSVVERELQAHLATCDECRAFAAATERLTASLKSLPSIPANPRTRREVMETVQRGRNPLAGLFAGFGGGFQSVPVLGALASIVLVGLFGWLALDRLVFNDGDGTDQNQIAAVPTEEPVERFIASPTEVPPTDTGVPTEELAVEPTAGPTVEPTEEPTAIPADEPTEEPTDEPEPAQEPMAVPTAEDTDEVTEEVAGEPAAEVVDEPVDLTTMSEPEDDEAPAEPMTIIQRTLVPTVEPTVAPTEEPTAEPTAEPTVEPTAEPTEEPTVELTQEPTAEPTVEPTAEPTEVPTAEPTVEPTNTPAIEPMEGTEVQTVSDSEPEDASETREGTGSGLVIQSTDSDENGEPGSAVIEPIDGAPEGIEPDDRELPTEADEDVDEIDDLVDSASQPLADVSIRYSNIAGDPSGKLGLTRDVRLEFMQVPDGASTTTPGGFRMELADTQPGVIQLCGDGFCEPSMETPESGTWRGDAPLGTIGQTSYFLRLYSDRTEVYAASSEGTQLVDPRVIAETGSTSPPTAVYESNGIMFAWLDTGEWLEISNGNAQFFSGNYPDPYNVRFAPLAPDGPLLGYFSGGTLIIAPVTAPDSPVFSKPDDGIDFDIAPPGDRVAVVRGSDIVIYDIQGDIVAVYEGRELQPRSLIWLNGGIVFVDRSTGALYEIPETAP